LPPAEPYLDPTQQIREQLIEDRSKRKGESDRMYQEWAELKAERVSKERE